MLLIHAARMMNMRVDLSQVVKVTVVFADQSQLRKNRDQLQTGGAHVPVLVSASVGQ